MMAEGGTELTTNQTFKEGKMKYFVMIVAILMLAVPAFAGHDQPELNGNAAVTSGVSGGVLSGNIGNGGSLAIEKAYNTSYAGFGTTKVGNTVTATTFGGSSGYTVGFAINGIAAGVQGGTFNANAYMSIPKH